MKKLCSLIWITLSLIAYLPQLNAQTIKNGILFLEQENYTEARKVFNQLASQNNPDAYFYLGELAYLDEKPDSAKYFYNKGITANTKSAINYIGLGKLSLDKKNNSEAKKNFDQAIKYSKSKDANIFYLIGKACVDAENRDLDQAITNLSKARDMDPKQSDYWSVLGDAYYFKLDGGNAMTSYETAINKDKNNPKNYMKRAKLWRSAKRYDEAAKALEECITMDSKYAPAYKDLIELYSYLGKYDKMTALLKQYTELVGDDVDARIRYVKFLCYQAKDYPTAISEAQKVVAAQPNNYVIYRWLGWAHYEKGNYQDAKNSMDKFFELVGDNKVYASDYEYLAKAANKLGDKQSAIKQYLKIVELDSTKTAYIDTIAKTYYEDKKYAEASNMYKMKSQKTKASSQDYYYWGMCQYNLKNYTRADSIFTRLTEVSPNWLPGFSWRARCNEQIDTDGKLGLSQPHYAKVIQLGTSDAANISKYKKNLIDAYNYLGYYFYLKKDFSNAIANYTKTIELDPSNATAGQALAGLKN